MINSQVDLLEQRLTIMSREMNEVLGELVTTVNSMRKLQMEFARYIDARVSKLEEVQSVGQRGIIGGGEGDSPTEETNPESGGTDK